MDWGQRLKSQPLRVKLIITAVGTAVVVFGVASSLTFRYWRQQSEAASEQQALLAAASVRSSLEASLTAGRTGDARGALRELVGAGVGDRGARLRDGRDDPGLDRPNGGGDASGGGVDPFSA